MASKETSVPQDRVAAFAVMRRQDDGTPFRGVEPRNQAVDEHGRDTGHVAEADDYPVDVVGDGVEAGAQRCAQAMVEFGVVGKLDIETGERLANLIRFVPGHDDALVHVGCGDGLGDMAHHGNTIDFGQQFVLRAHAA